MSTQSQIIANRRNALKSTGPRSAQGKSIVSKNALKHGLSAANNIISAESQAEFDRYREDFFAELAPTSPMEVMLADRIINLSWRLQRLYKIQNQTIDALSTPKTPSPLAKLLSNYRLPTQPDDSAKSESGPDLTLGRLARISHSLSF